jgi:hypothetical protein
MSDDYTTDPGPFTALERIDRAQAAAGSVADELETIAIDCDNREHLAFALDLARRIKRTIGDTERQLEQAIASSSDEPRFDVELLGSVQVRRRARRTGWDHEALDRVAVPAIADKEQIDEETVHAVVADYRQLFSVGAAKAAFAKATGYDLDEFCTVTPDGVSVQITTPGSAPRLDS